MPYQQNIAALPIAVVALDAVSNELPYLLPLMPALEAALVNVVPRGYQLLKA